MKLRDKKGFITVYAMLAMMFFVVFVVTASVTASRKLKLQTEANTALIDIYDKNMENMNQTGETTIPIYTQAQFEQIANWITNLSPTSTNPSQTEYMYINDEVYKLDIGRYDDTDDSEHDNYTFKLKTDLWFEGMENENDEDKNSYPYVPECSDVNNKYKYHTVIQFLELDAYKIHLILDGEAVFYGIKIKINDADDFEEIATGASIGNVLATEGAYYEITSDIDLAGRKLDLKNFSGKIVGTDGNGNRKARIIKGLKIDTSKGGWFDENSGTIDNLIFTDVEIDTTNHIDENQNLGIIAKSNSGKILNCTIQISNQTTEEFCLIDGGGKSFNNFGILVGTNSGTISDCNIQAVEIRQIVAQNLGLIAGTNSGTITNINIRKCRIGKSSSNVITGKSNFKIGGICGINTGTVGDRNSPENNNIRITDLKIYSGDNGNEYVAGVVGKNDSATASIKKIKIDNININSNSATYRVGGIVAYNAGSIENVESIGNIQNGTDVGLICGENNGSITSAIANGTTNGTNNVGLICGLNNSGKSIGSLTTSTISAIGSINGGTNVGLICGNNNGGTITNVLAEMASGGTVTGTDNVAIICGLNSGSGTISTVNSAKGTISGGTDRGIVCGENASGATINGASNIIGSINGGTNVGLICGNNAGSVTNVSAAMERGGIVTGTASGAYVAIICGNNSGTISTVNSAKGTIYGGQYRGIVCGQNSGLISNARGVTGTINEGADYAGLICGLNTNTTCDTSTLSQNPIYNVQANGTIEGGNYLGLVCGKNQGGIANAIVTGKIQGNGDDVGGVVGLNDGFIKNAIVNAEIRGQDAGGIVGNVGYSGNGTTIENCYSNVLFEIGTRKDSAGGIVGWVGGMPLTISNCAYVNEIKVGYSYIGGIVAYMNQNVTISSCYMNGTVPTNYGAIIGTKSSGNLSLTNVWYNQTYPWITNATDWNGTPKSSGELDNQITTLLNTIKSNIGI